MSCAVTLSAAIFQAFIQMRMAGLTPLFSTVVRLDRGQLGHDIALNDVSHLAQWPVFRNADGKVEARIGTVGTTHLNKRILSTIG